MDILNIIKTRRSVREYKPQALQEQDLDQILEAGRWAPSGLNNQPWRFLALQGDEKSGLCSFTTCGDIIQQASAAVVVCLDKKASYNRDKDLMAIGACIQNMLLQAHSLGIGSCWLGEILNRSAEVCSFLKLKDHLELGAVVTLGYAKGKAEEGERKILKNLMIR